MTCLRLHKHRVQQCGLHHLGCNNITVLQQHHSIHNAHINTMHFKTKHTEFNCWPLNTVRLAVTVICEGCYVFIGWE